MATTAQRTPAYPTSASVPQPTKMATTMEVTPAANMPEILPAQGKDMKDGKEVVKKAGGTKRARKEPEMKTEEMMATGTSTTMMEGNEKPEGSTTSYLIVAKSVRTFLKNLPTACHCGADALPTLNQKVTEMLCEASQRAHANGRKTLKSSDF